MTKKLLINAQNEVYEILEEVDKSINDIVILNSYTTEYSPRELDNTIIGIKAALIDLKLAVEKINNRLCNSENSIDYLENAEDYRHE